MAGRVAAKKTAANKTGRRKKAAKRDLVNTGTDKRHVGRGSAGRFKESDDEGKSLPVDKRKKATTKVSQATAKTATASEALSTEKIIWQRVGRPS